MSKVFTRRTFEKVIKRTIKRGDWEEIKNLIANASSDELNKLNNMFNMPFIIYIVLLCGDNTDNTDNIIEIILTLMEKEEEEETINSSTFPDGNCLNQAVKCKNVALVKFLLNNGVNSNQIEYESGTTPLTCAISDGSSLIAELLIKYKSTDLNKQDNNHDTPTSIALQKGNPKLFKLLLDYKVSLDYASRTKNPAFFDALRGRNAKIIEYFIENEPIDPNIKSIDNKTIIEFMLNYDIDRELFQKIINILFNSKKFDPNKQNFRGKTSLMLLVEYDDIENIKNLLENYDIDFDIEDIDGYSVFDYACNDEITELLSNHNPNNN